VIAQVTIRTRSEVARLVLHELLESIAGQHLILLMVHLVFLFNTNKPTQHQQHAHKSIM